MSRALARLGALLAIAASAAGMALLARYRPGLPDLPDSLSAPVTTIQLQQLALVAVWLLGALLLIVFLLRSIVALLAPARFRPRPTGHLYAPTPRRRASAHVGLTGSSQQAFAPPFPLILRGGSQRIDQDRNTRRSHSEPTRRGRRPGASIALLGPVEITAAEPRTRGLRSKTQQLLVYLALHPKGATTDELAAAVLPGVADERARRRVWRAISEVRSELGDVLPRSGDHYVLDRTAIAIDVDEFDFLIAQTKAERGPTRERLLERALALVRGQPLAGTDYPWAAGDIRHLCAAIVDVLHEIGELRLAEGNPAGALAAAERALTFDADNESAQRLAMRAESALGLREAVAKRYAQLSRRLARRFGLEPEQETRRVYRQLLGQDTRSSEAARRGSDAANRPVPDA
jgi:DNA-binding SARP family transcriptional activator